MADDRIEIEIVLDDGSVRRGFQRVVSEGKKTERRLAGSIGSALTGLRGQVLALGGAFATVFAGREILRAASAQEDAINNLNTALATAGTFSKEASQDLQDFASQLQSVTTVGDETTLEMIALGRAFTNTNEQAKDLVAAAAELSAATGIELESAVRNLGKSFSGLLGELGELVPQTRSLTAEQLKAGAAIDVISQRFGGSAQAQTRTFSGALQQLQNTFGDLLEEIGFLITRSPALVAIFNRVGRTLNEFAKSLAGFRAQNRDVFGELVESLIVFGQTTSTAVIAPLEILFNTVKTIFNGIQAVITGAITGIASAASRIVSFFAPDSELATNLQTFKDVSSLTFDSFVEDTKSAASAITDLSATESFDGFLSALGNTVEQAKPLFNELKNNSKGTTDSVKKDVSALGGIISGGLTNVLSQGIQQITQSLLQGGNAFGDFAKFALNILGDFAIQLGTFIIGASQAIDALKTSLLSFSGGLGIAAGIALIAIGGALKSFAGGPSSGSAGGGVADISDNITEDISEGIGAPSEEEEQRQGQEFVFNIEGAIDPRATAETIRDLLVEFQDSNGGSVVIA